MRSLLVLLAATLLIPAGGTAQHGCALPPIVYNAKSDNIFTPEQEVWLGDVFMDAVEKDYRVIDDAALTAYVQRVGDGVAKHLPSSGMSFRFVIADIPETNAYTFPGGRVMVTRKLISFVRSEDELAAVIGHELGHAVMHHGAVRWTKAFKEVLGVKSVGDRNDVFTKYHRYLEAYRTKSVNRSDDHQDKQQLEADRIGVTAVYLAGYDPNAMIPFWKRLTNAKKVGFFGSLFGDKRPVDKRLEEMVVAAKKIPAECVDKARTGASREEFESWKRDVISFSRLGEKEELRGLVYKRKLIPLRTDIQHLRFSPDGRYILAQDPSTVTVIQRDPLSILFRIDVEEAFPAKFSLDSRSLIVYNTNLRVEKWDLSSRKLMSAHEIALPAGGFWQTRISPDGNYIACYKYNTDLVVYDVASGDEVFKEKDFYLPTRFEVIIWDLVMSLSDRDEVPVLNLQFSPDGRYFLAGKKSADLPGILGSTYRPDETIAVDLTTRKKISIGDNIKKVLLTSMDFVGPDRVIGQFGRDTKKSGIFSFPSGERLAEFPLAGSTFIAAYRGDLVTVRPVTGAAVGLFDSTQKKFLFGNARSALDVYDRIFVAERRDGEVGLFNVDTRENFASIALPPSPFGGLRTTELSNDGKWLLVSDRSRGAAWDLSTGERKVHTRAFRGAFITPQGQAFSDFPRQVKSERMVAVMDLKSGAITPVGDIVSEDNIRQFGRYLLVRKPLKEKPEKPLTEEEKKRLPFSEEGRERPIPAREVLLEVRDVLSGELLWKRDFPNERPALSMNTFDNTMVFAWALNSDAASEIIKNDPELKARKDKMGSKEGDQLIEFVNPMNGEVKGHFLLETGARSFRPEFVTWAGEYVMVDDNQNRILIYSIATGDPVTKFFGSYGVFSPVTKQVAVENSPGRVMIADITTGKELGRLRFTHRVSLMRYTESGRRLFVLTADQTAFLFDAAKMQEDQLATIN